MLKVYEDSEVLLRIFKLFNLFYEKFLAEKEKIEAEGVEQIDTSTSQSKDALDFVRQNYQTNSMTDFVNSVSEVLKIVFKTNLEMNEGLSNLIFCVFSSFYPELLDSIKLEEKQNKEDLKLSEASKDMSKY